MENKKKSYWKGVEQLTNRTDFVKNNEKEFSEALPIKDAYGDNSEGLETNRRDFLKLMGFSVAAVSLAACETPVKKAIPYLNKPETVDPGIPNYYASTYFGGSDYCPVVVKTREGRPIHLEGNDFSKFSNGSINARAQAAVLDLYDDSRAKEPSKNKEVTSWEVIDEEIKSELSLISGNIYIVANTIVSPSTHQILGDFQAKYPNTKVVMYDQVSASAMTEANAITFGKAVVPGYNFDKANVIVSVGADFLGNWISSVAFTKDYSWTRKLGERKKNMSRHYQFEANMSLTGANADYRTVIRPSQEGLVVAKLYNAIANATGGTPLSVSDVDIDVSKAAKDLLAAKGKGLVVASANNTAVQLLVNSINEMLENYGTSKPIDMNQPMFVKQGDDKAMAEFVGSVGSDDAVVFYNCNPVYDHPQGADLAGKIGNAKLSVSTADRLDETAVLCTYSCPDSNFLESWGDAEPQKGMFSLAQPTIRTIFNTRQAQDSFLTWMGGGTNYKDYVQKFWETRIMPLTATGGSFLKFWQRSLHDGIVEPGKSILDLKFSVAEATAMDSGQIASAIDTAYKPNNTGYELVIFSSPVMGWGDHANNPFLQETPEPISKVCWGNYVAVSQTKATEMGVEVFETRTNLASVTIGDQKVSLPIVVQPGLQKDTIAIGMGWGRDESIGKVAKEAGGINAFRLGAVSDTKVQLNVTTGIDISNSGEIIDVAQTQTHSTIMGRRTIIQETTLDEYKEDPTAGAHAPHIMMAGKAKKPGTVSLWDVSSDGYVDEKLREGEKGEEKGHTDILWNERLGDNADVHTYPLHHWGMSIDLNSCTGCSACIIACHTENNVPIVGKQEVINRREMHWLRIDRYYSHPEGDGISHAEMEEATENPSVVFQPMMCQHCNNAPCETVCPVAATTHSSEGLNQMTYNRCVGTKYCANNCPYKVRRFNWFKYNNNSEFDYHMNNNLGKMVLNPDVTVRSRGVMEKCSMCVQRIQSGKLQAKKEGRKVIDGDVTTACAKACPADAITFGDLNDQKSQVRKLMDYELDSRAYNVLEEISVKPNVWYLRKVRNTDQADA